MQVTEREKRHNNIGGLNLDSRKTCIRRQFCQFEHSLKMFPPGRGVNIFLFTLTIKHVQHPCSLPRRIERCRCVKHRYCQSLNSRFSLILSNPSISPLFFVRSWYHSPVFLEEKSTNLSFRSLDRIRMIIC